MANNYTELIRFSMDVKRVQIWIFCLKGCFCFLLLVSFISQGKISSPVVGQKSLVNLELCYD